MSIRGCPFFFQVCEGLNAKEIKDMLPSFKTHFQFPRPLKNCQSVF